MPLEQRAGGAEFGERLFRREVGKAVHGRFHSRPEHARPKAAAPIADRAHRSRRAANAAPLTMRAIGFAVREKRLPHREEPAQRASRTTRKPAGRCADRRRAHSGAKPRGALPCAPLRPSPSAPRPTRSRRTGRRCGCSPRYPAAASPISSCRPAPCRTPSSTARWRRSGISSPGAASCGGAPAIKKRSSPSAPASAATIPLGHAFPVPRARRSAARLRRRHHAAVAGRGRGRGGRGAVAADSG